MHYIGVDIGTTSISGIIFEVENRAIETITREGNSTIKTNNHWETIQNPTNIAGVVQEIIEQFLKKYPRILGIGITGQMHGVLYIDKDGNPLSPLINWQDGRGNLLFKNNLSYAEFLSKETGYSVSSGFGLVTHFYNSINNLVPVNTHKLCTIMDFVVMKLTGNKEPLIDPSNAAGLGFFDIQKLQFDMKVLDKFSLDHLILPEVRPSGELAGLYNNFIPVYSAIGDNQASFLGAVHDLEDSILLNIGTSAQLSLYSSKYQKIEFFDTRPFPGGGYLLTGAVLCGGESLALLKRLFEATIKMFSGLSPETIDFYKIMSAIDYETIINLDLPIVKTLFSGTRSDSGIRGQISNISLTNLTPENLITGFINGIGAELSDFYQQIPSYLRNKQFLIGSGNGVRLNKSLCRSLEKQFQRRLYIPKQREEAAFGACLLAVVADKYVEDILNVGRMIELTTAL